MMHDHIIALSALFTSTVGLGRFRRVVALLGSPRTLTSGLRAALRLQRETIVLPNSIAGREIKHALRARHTLVPNSLAAGLLELPDEPDSYFKGRRRQALRTNMRRAEVSGMTVREPDESEVGQLLDLVLALRGSDAAHRRAVTELLPTSPSRFWVVEQEGQPLGLAAVTIAGEVAYLGAMLSVPSEDSSAARYLLSGRVFEILARDGVRSVLSGSRLVMSPGVIYFQERLGFEPRRLVLG